MLLQIFLLLLSVLLLYYGAEFSLESAEKIGLYLGLSPLVIGLLIIGFGTSLPEFFVSQLATIKGNSSIALGNIVGSNVANIFLILGLSSVLTNLYINTKEIFEQLVFHLVLTFLAFFIFTRKEYNFAMSLLLWIFFFTYLVFTYVDMRKKRKERILHVDKIEEKIHVKDFLFLFLGFFLLYLGGDLLVDAGSSISRFFGVSEYMISVIFVAFGTSFPEFVTSVMTCVRKKNTDLILGNILGSNIFNLSFVLSSIGHSSFLIKQNFVPEFSLLLFVSLFFIILYYLKRPISRFVGFFFLCCYSAMVYYWI